jgi:hypothetical protein
MPLLPALRVARATARHPQAQLHHVRNRYAPDVAAEKERLLRELLATPPRTRRQAAAFHDDLLFLRAFPDNATVAKLAQQGLDQFALQLHRFRSHDRRQMDDSGIASSNSRHTFPFAIARWLTHTYPTEVEIDWEALTDHAHVDTLIRTFITRAEEDAFDSGEIETPDWLRLAQPPSSPSALHWLMSNGGARPRTLETFAALYDAAPLPIIWRLKRSLGSSTLAKLPVRAHFRAGMRLPPESPLHHIAVPLPGIELLQRPAANRVIDLARSALTARCREVFAISNPNRDEVWLADLGEGASLAIIGAMPAIRMSLEANYGYLLMSNGVPIGYGGITPLYCQANTGINIFDPFRGSEAALLWAQMLRAFRTLFGVRRFVVNGYQVGEGNTEAIASGAFWFYYRLGFRPCDATARELAAKEAQRLARDRTYRSPPKVLRALARGDLHLTLPGFAPTSFVDEHLLVACARRVSQRLATAAITRRDRGAAGVQRRVAETLGVRSSAAWPREERAAFGRLAPVVDLLPDLRSWSAAERETLVKLMRAKGAPQERDFVRRSQSAPRFWRELRRLLRAPDSSNT